MLLARYAVLCVFILVLSHSTNAQAVGDYRSVADGNWTTLATWQRLNALPSSTPANWATPTAGQGYPGQSTVPATVTIQNTHDVVLNGTPPSNIGNLVIGGGTSG